MDILCLGQQNWDHCWTGKQQLTSRLAERGHRVLYVDPDLPPVETDEDVRAQSVPGVPGLRHRGPGDLWTYTYPPIRRLGWRINMARKPRMLPGVLRAVGFHAPVVLCLHPNQTPNLERANAGALVYYAVDEYTAYEGMTEESRRDVRRAEDAILDAADRVLAVSEGLRRRFSHSNEHAFVLENGSDVEHYSPERLERIAPHPEMADLEGPVIGFIGQVDSRVDQALIAEVAESRPDWTFVLAGRRTPADMSLIEGRANVRMLGYTPYEALPSVAKAVDVWTVPYVENTITHACNPLKVYEYLATGKPIVSRPLDGIAVCRDVLTLAREPDAFRAGIEAALAAPEAGRDARIERAEANDWYDRVGTLEDHLEAAIVHARDTGRWAEAVRTLPKTVATPALDRTRTVDEYGAPRDPGMRRRGLWRAAIAVSKAMRAGPNLVGRLSGRAPRRILVARHGHLGDFVALQPMLAHLRRMYPEAQITLGVDTGSIAKALYADAPEVDAVEEIDLVPWRIALAPQERLRRWLRLVSRRYDLVVAGASWFYLEESNLTGAPDVVGHYDGRAHQALGARLLRRDRFRHHAENELALAEAVTGEIAAPEARRPVLHVDEETARREAQAALERLGAVGARIAIVHPGSKLGSRRWPLERMAAVVTRLLDDAPDLAVVLTGTAGERPLADALVSRVPERLASRAHDALGATSLAGLAGLLDRASLVLSNDTGIMHLARARGAPLVAVLGPENHKLWGPHPQGTAPAVAIRREVPCAPCRLDTCAAHWCLASVGVDEVVRAAQAVLSKGRAAGGALRLDVRRRSWAALKRDGFVIPKVAVVVEEDGPGEERLEAVLPMVEGQTYPDMEIIHVRPPDAPTAQDRRGAERRRALPLRRVARGAAPLADHVGAEVVVVAAHPGEAWPPQHIGRQVAARARRGKL